MKILMRQGEKMELVGVLNLEKVQMDGHSGLIVGLKILLKIERNCQDYSFLYKDCFV